MKRISSHRVTKSQSHKRKEEFLLMISFFGILVLSSGCAQRQINNIDSKGKNIICFGDSMTFGYGVERGEDYPAFLAKLVSIPVINTGIDGDTTVEGLKRIDSDVLDKDPRLVIIEFGGNDFLKNIPVEETIKNIGKMVDKIQSGGAMVALVDISAGFVLDAYRAQIYKMAKQKRAIFISSILQGIITNPRLKSDFLHPNEKGYGIIAQKIYRAIAPYLKKTKS